MARLAVTREKGQSEEVHLGEVTVLGREQGADVVLPAEGVSRHHARITRTEDGYLLEDLWSRNGTFVNRRRVRRKALQDGDAIDICEWSLTFHLEPEDKGQPEPPPAMVFEEAPAAAATALPVEADGSLARAVAEAERLRARLRAIYEVTDAIDITLTLGEFLENALDKLLEIFPQADVAVLMLKDLATGTMAPRASRLRSGLDPEQVTISTSVMRETAKKRQALLSSTAGDDPRFRATMTIRRSSIASLMCVPLVYREDLTGLLYVDSRRAGVAFQEDDLALLTWLGREINLALERSRMRRELLQRQRIERDMHLAVEMQRSFLPDEPPSVEGYEFALHHVPAMAVGGDFYDFLPLEGGRLAIVIGEVAGKGIAAALLVARVTSHIRYLSLECASPGELLDRLNELLVERAPRGTFATLLYAVLELDTRQLTLASAAHLAPLRVAAAAGRVEDLVLPRQFPLGALDDTCYEDLTIQLDEGDHLVLYTDGIIDASNAQGEWYGENRLYRVLASAPRAPRPMLDALLADVGTFADEAGENDDMTAIIFRVGEPTP